MKCKLQQPVKDFMLILLAVIIVIGTLTLLVMGLFWLIGYTTIQFVIYNKKFKKLIKTDRLNFLKSESNYLHNQSSINEAATGISLGSGTGTIHYDLIERDYK